MAKWNGLNDMFIRCRADNMLRTGQKLKHSITAVQSITSAANHAGAPGNVGCAGTRSSTAAED